MTSLDHDELELLVAAAALDALDDDSERAAVETHLATCEQCRRAFDEYREVAARLVPAAHPPPDLWERVAGQLDAQRRAAEPDHATGWSAGSRRWLAVAAAVAALIAGIAIGRLSVDDTPARLADLAEDARARGGTELVTLATPTGVVAAEAIVADETTGYLVAAALLPLPADRAYQLWAFRDGEPLSLAVLGPTPDVAAFGVPGRFDRLAITDEPAAGSPAPTGAPVATSTR
ncbi:MAG: anti-sigma factor domain-containing protein [Acidimicrobiales bacterium]